MDQKQREIIETNIAKLADIIDYNKVAPLTILAKLITEDQIKKIEESVKSRFCRNRELLYALQNSSSATTFDDLLEILYRTENKDAIKYLCPGYLCKRQSRMKNFLDEAADKFKSQNYPLGMNSGESSLSGSFQTSPQSSFYLGYQGDPALSPLKEKHQATLVGSGASSTSLPIGDNTERATGIDLAFGTLASNGGVHMVAPSSSGLSNSSSSPQLKLRRTRRTISNQYSQTPTRSQELILINNLSLSDQSEALDHENEEPLVCWHPYAQPQPVDADAQRSSSPHYCYPSYVSTSSGDSDASSDSVVLDPNHILDPNVTMVIAKPGEPNVMTVKKASVCYYDQKFDYKMTSRPRGPCLIINNIDFEADIFPTRKGSDEDAKRFDDIFQQLGFSVELRRNQTADQMKALFKDVARKCRPEHDALFIFILSHGSEHGIYGTDGIEVYLESEIISCFDNRNCKNMIGKPKVFVIQACRGRSKDYGGDGDATDSIAWPSVMTSPSVHPISQENRVPANLLPANPPKDSKHRKHPIRTDMLLIFSCLAGYVSVRNELAGSWLGVALAYFIMTHAHDRDLMRILNLVTSDVIQRESSNGHIQSIEVKLLGWTKNLYFNPGIFL